MPYKELDEASIAKLKKKYGDEEYQRILKFRESNPDSSDEEGTDETKESIPPEGYTGPVDLDVLDPRVKQYFLGAEAALRFKGEAELLALMDQAFVGPRIADEIAETIMELESSGRVLVCPSIPDFKLDTGLLEKNDYFFRYSVLMSEAKKQFGLDDDPRDRLMEGAEPVDPDVLEILNRVNNVLANPLHKSYADSSDEEDNGLMEEHHNGLTMGPINVPPEGAGPVDLDTLDPRVKQYFLGAEAALRFKGEADLLALMDQAFGVINGYEGTTINGSSLYEHIREGEMSGLVMVCTSIPAFRLDTGLSGSFGYSGAMTKVKAQYGFADDPRDRE
jgi:hypothetical protein